MTDPRRLFVAIGFLAVAAAGGWVAWSYSRQPPDLARAIALAEAGRFDEAEAVVGAYLKLRPAHGQARMLAAQFALNRPAAPAPEGELPDPRPAEAALGHLDAIRGPDAGLAALVELHRGKALYRLGRLDEAERAWLEALRLDPRIPEAGFHLLELYYLEGRPRDARPLALRLHAEESDPRDRVRYLLDPLRYDTQPPAPASVVNWFRPVVEGRPEGRRARLALGVALARAGSAEQGLEAIRPALEADPGSVDAWEAWLTVLDDAGEAERLSAELERVPPSLASSPRLARFFARDAQEEGDWEAAARLFREAARDDPADRSLEYRLGRALRHLGRADEAGRVERSFEARQKAKAELSSLHREALDLADLGLVPRPDLYRRIADARERMGFPDEALAWHRLALRADPSDPTSLAKAAELEARAAPARGPAP